MVLNPTARRPTPCSQWTESLGFGKNTGGAPKRTVLSSALEGLPLTLYFALLYIAKFSPGLKPYFTAGKAAVTVQRVRFRDGSALLFPAPLAFPPNASLPSLPFFRNPCMSTIPLRAQLLTPL